MNIGRFTLKGDWDTEPDPLDGIAIRLSPTPPEAMLTGMTVFGQGRHESTRWSLAQVEALVKPGMTFCDFGSGTGILAIAAAKLGAKVSAVENDPVARQLCEDNVALNGVDVAVVEAIDGMYDLIIANIGEPKDGPDWRTILTEHLTPDGQMIFVEDHWKAPVIDLDPVLSLRKSQVEAIATEVVLRMLKEGR